MQKGYILNATTALMVIYCSIMSVRGQNEITYTPRDYRLVPPSPGVASLLEQRDFAMENFRGIPDISFPIYEIRCGAITVPIVLSYQGGGIKAGQKQGNAGLSWQLILGAQIGHTVIGAPDDANMKDKLHGLAHLDDDERIFRNKLINYEGDDGDYNPTSYEHFLEKRSWIADKGKNYYEGRADVANDQYTLYGCGLSAVFAFDEYGIMIKSSEKPIKITRHFNDPQFADVILCDISGRVYYAKAWAAGWQSMQIPINSLTPGQYLLHIATEEEPVVYKFTKL